MALSPTLNQIVEYRGIRNLVAAPVLTDTADGITFGNVFAIAGVAEISKTANSSAEAHYYDNMAAVVITAKGADEITINTSAIPLDVLATITGQFYDETTGMLVEGNPKPQYFALGYITEDTNGNEVYVWRLKGMFQIPDQTNSTKNDGTDANGQELTYMGINTIAKFNKNDDNASSVSVNMGLGLANPDGFFDTVQTPDTVAAREVNVVTIRPAADTTITVLKNGILLGNYTGAAGQSNVYTADASTGDRLKISVTGGTVTVNSDEWFSGDIHIVTGAVTIASTASA